MRKLGIGPIVLITVAVLGLGLPTPAEAAFTRCRLHYHASAWAVFYQSLTGTGTIRCDNGQSANVRLRLHGGGLALGAFQVEGRAVFSDVRELDEVLGTYFSAEGHAGAVKAASGRLLTKGMVSASQYGLGSGFNFGVALGALQIRR